jgi:predicted ArsR family transcriptional regulator
MANWLEQLIGETQWQLLRLLRRSRQTITSLAEALGLTDNAIRTHVATLRRDGLVEDIGAQRDTGGKPARVYGLTREGEELFPKAYAPVLGMLIEEVIRRSGRAAAVEVLRRVGSRIAGDGKRGADLKQRVAAAAAAFEQLGTDVDVQRTAAGWRLQSHGCPLSAVTSDHAEACELGKAVVEKITGAPVTECCARGAHPRCAFTIEN